MGANWVSLAGGGRRFLSYVQGQSPCKFREYFYFIDHHGQLFLDDAKMKNFTSCFKDKEFLTFFFKHLRRNCTGRYEDEFPYISLCGTEHNYIRCDDRPIVYTAVTTEPDGCDKLSYGNAGSNLTVPFEPQRLFMWPNTGRLYYPAAEELGGVGLISSALAIRIGSLFRYANNSNEPTDIQWRDKKYLLTNELSRIFSSRNNRQ
ncbi:hypothetical protein M514_10433 [Trichuris suis]|uniref:Uncharacterized protein n=1 Tax=Trichuris suis TaxID=68888 RepID=A0A085NIL7_9BILA|nr:hypothetical protein M513_10433 [Trichuris suis]KFD69313.1 hypothetical protein M514_10433 [Trichuris suis]